MKKNSFISSIQSKRWQYTFLGALLSFIGPLGEWLVVKLWFKDVDIPVFVTLIYIEIFCLVIFCAFGYKLGRYAEKVEELAFYDQLTGLFSRHYFIKKLNELTQYSSRYQERFSLILLDLDHFKSVNDKYGHIVGDKTLTAVASSIIAEIRASDFVGRYGGEEFIIVCPSTTSKDSVELAERIRLAVQKIDKNYLGWPGPQTISAGVYEVPQSLKEHAVANLIHYADVALYQAKESGRNKVVIYQDD